MTFTFVAVCDDCHLIKEECTCTKSGKPTASMCPNCGADSYEFRRVPAEPGHANVYVCLRCEMAVTLRFLPSNLYEVYSEKLLAKGKEVTMAMDLKEALAVNELTHENLSLRAQAELFRTALQTISKLHDALRPRAKAMREALLKIAGVEDEWSPVLKDKAWIVEAAGEEILP